MTGVPGPRLLPMTDFVRSEFSRHCQSAVTMLVEVQKNAVVQDSALTLERIYRNPIFSAATIDGKLNPRARQIVTMSRDHFKSLNDKITTMTMDSLPRCYHVCNHFCSESANLTLNLSEYHIDNTEVLNGGLKKVGKAFESVDSGLDAEKQLINSMESELKKTISNIEELEKMNGRTMLKLGPWIAVLVTSELTSPGSPNSSVPKHLQTRFKEYLDQLAVASRNLEIVKNWVNETHNSLKNVEGHQSRAASFVSSHLTEIEIDMQMKLRDLNREWINAGNHFLRLIPECKAISQSNSINDAMFLLKNTGATEDRSNGNNGQDDSHAPRLSLPGPSIFHRISTLLDILSHVPYIKEFVDVLRVFLDLYSKHHEAHEHVERLLLEATELAADAQMEIKEERMDSRDLMQLERLANNLQRLLKGCLQTSKGNTDELQSCAKSCRTGLDYGLQKISFFRLSSLGVEHREQYSALRAHITDMRDDTIKGFCSSMDRLERNLQANFQDCASRINSNVDEVKAEARAGNLRVEAKVDEVKAEMKEALDSKIDEVKAEAQAGNLKIEAKVDEVKVEMKEQKLEIRTAFDEMEGRLQQGLKNLGRPLDGRQGRMFLIVQTAASTPCNPGEGLMFSPGESYLGGSGVLHHRNGSRHLITSCRRAKSAPAGRQE